MGKPKDAFEFHTRLDYFERGDNQKNGLCPFCLDPEQTFYYDKDTLLWDCKAKKKCGRSGNLHTFIQSVYSELCTVNQDEITRLAIDRKLPVDSLITAGIRWNPLVRNIVLPTFNSEHSINNLLRVFKIDGKLRILSTPTLVTLYNYPEKVNQMVWLVEGHWDKIAGDLITAGNPITVIGYPGNAFLQKWCNLLGNKNVILFTDNDDAGNQHKDKIIKRILSGTQKPRELATVNFHGKPNGYDVRDCFIEYGEKALSFISHHVEKVDNDAQIRIKSTNSNQPAKPSAHASSYSEVKRHCEDCYHWTKEMDQLLTTILATTYSLKFHGEQPWVRVTGPAGTAKTTIAKLLAGSEYSVIETSITGIFSGYEREDAPGEDCSMLPIINGRNLMITDADTIVNEPNSRQIMSQFRTVYDQDISVRYRTGLHLEVKDLRSIFTLMGTPNLRLLDDTSLGERFLDFELNPTEQDKKLMQQKAYEKSIKSMQLSYNPETLPAEAATYYLDNFVMENDRFVIPSPEARDYMEQMAVITTYMRTPVKRNRDGTLKVTPSVEGPTRITGQLTKFMACCPVILDQDIVSQDVMSIVQKQCRDIMNSRSPRFRVANTMYHTGNYIDATELATLTGLEASEIKRVLSDMYELQMLDTAIVTNGQYSLPKAKLKDDLQSKFGKVVKL